MSSTADAIPATTTTAAAGARRTVNKRAAPAGTGKAAKGAAAAPSSPVIDDANADAVAPAAGSKKRLVKVPAAEPAKPAAKKRGAKAAAADPEASEAGDSAAVPAPKPKRATGGKKKAAATDAAADTTDGGVATPVANGDNNTDAAADGGADGAKKPSNRKRVKRTYIVAFGDLHVPAKERDDSRIAFDRWLVETAHTVKTITFTDWKAMKRGFYRDIEQLGKKHKKTRKQNQQKTSENHYKRLLEMPATEFAELHGVWLSAYGFDGAYTAEQLKEDIKDNELILGALAVYRAAVAHGYQPLGIVSEKSKKEKEGEELHYVTNVEGDRVYVGIGLPFKKDKTNKKSKFCVEPSDRAFFAVEPEAAADTEVDEE